ncbi:hypothetical protein Q4Q95_13725 [Morganella morganii]
MSRTNLESNLSSAQSVGEKLLILLKKHGPMQASEAGEHLGTTGEAARQQFTKLARDGMGQGFCRAELELFQTVLNASVERVEYLLTDSRRCVYRVIQQED